MTDQRLTRYAEAAVAALDLDVRRAHDQMVSEEVGRRFMALADAEAMTHQPLTYRLHSGDLGYIVDALLAAAEARRARGGGGALQQRIADHLDELAITLHDAKVEAIEAAR